MFVAPDPRFAGLDKHKTTRETSSDIYLSDVVVWMSYVDSTLNNAGDSDSNSDNAG